MNQLHQPLKNSCICWWLRTRFHIQTTSLLGLITEIFSVSVEYCLNLWEKRKRNSKNNNDSQELDVGKIDCHIGTFVSSSHFKSHSPKRMVTLWAVFLCWLISSSFISSDLIWFVVIILFLAAFSFSLVATNPDLSIWSHRMIRPVQAIIIIIIPRSCILNRMGAM